MSYMRCKDKVVFDCYHISILRYVARVGLIGLGCLKGFLRTCDELLTAHLLWFIWGSSERALLVAYYSSFGGTPAQLWYGGLE